MNKKVELLAPAGNYDKMLTAFRYGADAVYLGGNAFGLRAKADNLTDGQIEAAVKYANSLGKKIYVTANIISRDADLPPIAEYAKFLESAGVHGVIVADIGTFMVIKEAAPCLPIHVSTQANNLNWKTIDFWLKNGATRVNLARELSLEEIKGINYNLLLNNPELAEAEEPYLEAFVHGAMCMSYSGRCMLSDYLAERSSNRGDCAQPCRWNYNLVEEKRPGEYIPVFENERGTFIFNSKDLCMLEYLPDIINCGVGSLKIEGRMKSEFYTATTVRAYRVALDACLEDPEGFRNNDALKKELMEELLSCSHRDYYTGFYFGGKGKQIYGSSSYKKNTDFIGCTDSCEAVGDKLYRLGFKLRGAFNEGERLEIISPDVAFVREFTVTGLKNGEGESISRAANAMMEVTMDVPFSVAEGSMIRRRTGRG